MLFEPLRLGSLRVKNRVLRSSVAGRFDNFDGSGTDVRINWDVSFARGGVGAAGGAQGVGARTPPAPGEPSQEPES